MRPEQAPRTRSRKQSSQRNRPNLWQFLFGRGRDKQSAATRLQSETTLQPIQPFSDRYPDGLQLFQPGRSSHSPTQMGMSRRPVVDRSQSGSTLPFRKKPDPAKLDPAKLDSAKQRPSDRTRLARSPQSRTVLQANTVLQPDAPTRLEGKRLEGKRLEGKRLEGKVKPRRERRPANAAARRDRPPALPAKPARRLSRGERVALYVTRLLVLSIGIGVLAGTLLSVWDPATRATSSAPQPTKAAAPVAQAVPVARMMLGQELTPLKTAVQTLIAQSVAQSPQTAPGVFFLDLDTNAYVDVNGTAPIPAASTIKVPILVALFQEVDAGKVRLDEMLTMRKELIGTGSGDMQWQAPGTQFTVLETVQNMITVSDNTATNMVIARLGGITMLNQRFKSWGLTSTTLSNVLPDLEGTNLTTAKDMGFLMLRVSQGELISARSRDRALGIMQKTVNDSLLPRGLAEGATIAHKTGDIGTSIGDVGLVDVPNGKRYVAVVLAKRAFNDDRAAELIRQISRTAYQFLSRPTVSPPAVRATGEMLRNPDGSVVNPEATALNLTNRAENSGE